MTFAVLLAAGSSRRFAQTCPPEETEKDKLFARLEGGKSVWESAFYRLYHHPEVEGVGIVCREGEEGRFREAPAHFVVAGGRERWESALQGVRMSPQGAEWILLHDGARPFPSNDLISRVIHAGKQWGAAIPVLPVEETLKRVEGSRVSATLSREGLFRAQTPQVARRDWLLTALPYASDCTDDAQALEKAGFSVATVAGDPRNIKITSYEDLKWAKEMALEHITLVGFGYDVHRFSEEPTRRLVLGGVAFPGEQGLSGHSDADVVLHAVTDALLGALGAGDIGMHFPDNDPQWKDANSRVFLREAYRLLQEAGGEVLHVDITILAERPRIAPSREEMRSVIAGILDVSWDKINIKATTHEGLGAIGRGEGIAAYAIVTISKTKVRF
jgi:2-C-methyl-D-erythritol 4-phosphate cytidylyltransferase/2-C-methyl-D-erythritol 2,4-cyclodiphosphate synthase